MTRTAVPDWRELDFASAAKAVADVALRTPVLRTGRVARHDTPVWLKLENLQVTGSFKVRGAASKMARIPDSARRAGVVTCSSGNHGRAVAYVADRLGIPATVCVPEWVDPVKLEGIRAHGAETILHGTTYDEAEEKSLAVQRARGLAYVHPFDDPEIIAGQGTIGLELLEQMPALDTVVVPVSGGGLIAGVAAAVKGQRPAVRVIGVSAANARVMYESLQAGRPLALAEDETVATALAGGIGLDNRYSFPWVQQLVDDNVLVSEAEILDAMRFAVLELKLVLEGGGAVALAAILVGKVMPSGETAVVLSGGNVDAGVLAAVVDRGRQRPNEGSWFEVP